MGTFATQIFALIALLLIIAVICAVIFNSLNSAGGALFRAKVEAMVLIVTEEAVIYKDGLPNAKKIINYRYWRKLRTDKIREWFNVPNIVSIQSQDVILSASESELAMIKELQEKNFVIRVSPTLEVFSILDNDVFPSARLMLLGQVHPSWGWGYYFKK